MVWRQLPSRASVQVRFASRSQPLTTASKISSIQPPEHSPSDFPATRPLLGSHTTYFGPPNVPRVAKDSRDASIINDCGDNKQLEFISQRSECLDLEFHDEALFAGTGATFSAELGPFDTSAPPSQLDTEDEPSVGEHRPIPKDFHQTLKQKINGAMHDSMWTEDLDKEFLPFDRLAALITKNAIETELLLHGVDPNKVPSIGAKIRGITSSNREKTTRRKLFAILVSMDQVLAILDLIDENILDSDLPFTFGDRKKKKHRHVLQRKSADGSGLVPVKSLQSWERHNLDVFHTYQWRVMSPFLQLSNASAPKVHHYPLLPHMILPFIADRGARSGEGPDFEELDEMDMENHEGGFSEVRKVQIHPHHHNLFDPNAPEMQRNPYFAVKILKEGTTAEAFQQEVDSLKRVMEEDHPSLIRLLGTFERRKRYHLVFPWADSNLQHFWEQEFPHPDEPRRDEAMVRWLAREFSGLAGGLKLVHQSPIRKGNKQLLKPVSQKIYGRHGDIKTTNILWFRGGCGADGPCLASNNPDDMGSFQIADFGFADFHSQKSIEVPAQMVGRSPTHRAPECDGTANVSPKSDFWSLGAVLLEFVVWYMHGWEGHDQFSFRRQEDDCCRTQLQEDKYFNIYAGADSYASICELKASVREEIQNLRQHERCSFFFSDLLDLIEKKLLLIKAEDRVSCEELVDKLNDLHRKCGESAEYCTRKKPIPATPAARRPGRRDSSELQRSLDSQTSTTTRSTVETDYSFNTQRSVPTRETTWEDEERVATDDSQQARLEATMKTPGTPTPAAAGVGGKLLRRNSGRAIRADNITPGKQEGGGNSDPPPVPPARRQSWRKREPASAVVATGSAYIAAEARPQQPRSNLRKRKASDQACRGESGCFQENKVPRRSTA